MSIRRKSTTHDLATLRLHPDGSRVQQSSVNAKHRTAGSTVVDSRGNWIARDAGGKSSVKIRRAIEKAHTGDAAGECIDLSEGEGGDEEQRNQSKGKQPARDNQIPDEDPLQEPEWRRRLNTRTRRRLSFLNDLSFLDPAQLSVSSLEQDVDYSDATCAREPTVSFTDPAPDLLKSIHHFASCYYRERGQLFDSSRNYRGMKKERRRKLEENIHTLAANTRKQPDSDSGTDFTGTEEEITEEDENEGSIMEVGESGKEGPKTKGEAYKKDMYKALHGSALMAIGIVLQEYVAHTLSLGPSEEPRHPKRRKTG